MIRYAFIFLQHSTLSAADLALLGDLLLVSFAVVVLLMLSRVVWRLLRSVVQSMAGLLSWAIAVAAIVFLLGRLVRFLG